jgi:hypothetical protein
MAEGHREAARQSRVLDGDEHDGMLSRGRGLGKPPTDSPDDPFFLLIPYCAGTDSINATAWWIDRPPPQGPSLGSGLFCPGPSSLNRPHPPRSQAHRDFAAGRLICNAFAVRERLGDPRVVPSFHCSFLPNMPSSTTPGSSTPLCPDSLMPTLAFAEFRPARHSRRSRNPLHAGVTFVASLVRYHATACQVARPPARIKLGFPGQRGLLHPGFQQVSRPSHCWI